MRKILEKCPSCGGDLEVTRLSCTNCETVITGRYQPCRFCKLAPEHQNFLEAFVKSRGNVKEMERELGISYWTIRTQLNDLIKALGFEVDTPQEEEDESEVKHRRKEILEQLDRGEIDASEATERLAQLR
ncbi:MAG: hypothetical protein DCC55_03680 [Chloroflexi bacterium]|nr:MAG: hypothetical protein DCC55_03680 [Chloroflexota bacterium]